VVLRDDVDLSALEAHVRREDLVALLAQVLRRELLGDLSS